MSLWAPEYDPETYECLIVPIIISKDLLEDVDADPDVVASLVGDSARRATEQAVKERMTREP